MPKIADQDAWSLRCKLVGERERRRPQNETPEELLAWIEGEGGRCPRCFRWGYVPKFPDRPSCPGMACERFLASESP